MRYRYVPWKSPEAQAAETVTYGCLGFGIAFLLLLPRILIFLVETRMIIPVIYEIVVSTRFAEWQAAHHVMSNRIEIALIVLVFVSWIVELILAIRKRRRKMRNQENH